MVTKTCNDCSVSFETKNASYCSACRAKRYHENGLRMKERNEAERIKLKEPLHQVTPPETETFNYWMIGTFIALFAVWAAFIAWLSGQ